MIATDNIRRSDINTYQLRKETSEICLSLIHVYETCNLDEASKLSFEAIINEIQDVICSEQPIAYYCSFYNLPTAVYEHDHSKLSREIFASNSNISCFRCRIFICSLLGLDFDSSTDRYFYTRGEKIIKAISNFISYPFEFDYSSIIYLVLNYYQALLESLCINSINTIVVELIKSMVSLLEKINASFLRKYILSDMSLLSFWNATVPVELKSDEINLPENPTAISTKQRWALISLYKTNYKKANEYFHLHYQRILGVHTTNSLTEAQNIRLICNAITSTSKVSSKNCLIVVNRYKNSSVKYPLSYFFNGYHSASEVEVSDQDYAKLYSFDDSELRSRVALCMQNIDPSELSRQFTKPHGALEISDMDLSFIESSITKHLCMPFKTGREITGPSVPVEVAYQLFRPFVFFGSNCFVVFITAKPISQALEMFIQLLRNQLPYWKIDVIQQRFLIQLLKYNNQF